MKKKIIVIVLCIIVIALFIISNNINDSKEEVSSINDIDIEINTDDDDTEINWSNYENREIILDESITITEGGVYNLSGAINNGLVTVNTLEDVLINLNNVTITNETGPAIYIENAENTVINLIGENNLTNGTNQELNGTIYSEDDLIIKGDGTLNIFANYEDGIVSKDDLKIVSGTYNIKSEDEAIRGNDSVYIIAGIFNLQSSGDGIKTTEEIDLEKGFIKITAGTFNIESKGDGIVAQSKLLIENGTFNIKTSTTNSSAKGIKSGDNIVINSGDFIIDTYDDAIHSNNYIGIKDGNFKISANDDGIHADSEIIIENGDINIAKSYEGIEASKITINNGKISIVASDDGINIAGGNDSSSLNRPGMNSFNNNINNILTINNGSIYIDATGDGIDVNGKANINGGNIVIEGPTNDGNSALDFDNQFNINGGFLIASGSNGMLEEISDTSNQYSVVINFNQNLSTNKVTIVNSSDEIIIDYSSNKKYNSLIVSSDKFVKNEEYTIKIDNDIYETFTISNITNHVGNSKNMNSGGHRLGGIPRH